MLELSHVGCWGNGRETEWPHRYRTGVRLQRVRQARCRCQARFNVSMKKGRPTEIEDGLELDRPSGEGD